MRCPQNASSSTRGAALLVALAIVVVLTTAAASLARLATTTAASREVERWDSCARDLLAQADLPIRTWLESKADDVVLPPDAAEARVGVLEDHFEARSLSLALSITAWDECGMVQLADARRGSALRSRLSESVRRAVDEMRSGARAPLGLDQLVAPGERTLAFPRAGASASSALGAFVATHGSGRLNAATAPIPLLEAALRASARGGLEAIVSARTKGERPSAMQPAPSNSISRAPDVVVGSDCWAFRVDAQVASVRRAAWWVYARASSSWKRVQSLVAPG